MKGGFVLIIIIVIVAFVLDALTNKCIQNSFQAGAVVFLHHFIYVFSLLGWLLDDPALLIIYVTLPAIVWLHWKTSKYCFVDDVTANICGGHTQFNHLGHRFGIPDSIMGTIVICGVVIALWKLYLIFTGRRKVGPQKDSIPSPLCRSKRCEDAKNRMGSCRS